MKGNRAISLHLLHLLPFFICFIFFKVLHFREVSQIKSTVGEGVMSPKAEAERKDMGGRVNSFKKNPKHN